MPIEVILRRLRRKFHPFIQGQNVFPIPIQNCKKTYLLPKVEQVRITTLELRARETTAMLTITRAAPATPPASTTEGHGDVWNSSLVRWTIITEVPRPCDGRNSLLKRETGWVGGCCRTGCKTLLPVAGCKNGRCVSEFAQCYMTRRPCTSCQQHEMGLELLNSNHCTRLKPAHQRWRIKLTNQVVPNKQRKQSSCSWARMHDGSGPLCVPADHCIPVAWVSVKPAVWSWSTANVWQFHRDQENETSSPDDKNTGNCNENQNGLQIGVTTSSSICCQRDDKSPIDFEHIGHVGNLPR